jgi:hypothetical protein
MREQLRLAELSFSVRFHQARTSAVENTNRPLRVNTGPPWPICRDTEGSCGIRIDD